MLEPSNVYSNVTLSLLKMYKIPKITKNNLHFSNLRLFNEECLKKNLAQDVA